MATGPRATPEFMESIAAETGRPAFMVTVLTMYNQAHPERALEYYERCAAAIARGHEVYIHTSCQPLSFDFTLREPYLLYSHDAFDRVKAAPAEERAASTGTRRSAADSGRTSKNPKDGILFYGDWSQVEQDGVPVTAAGAARKDPLDYFFDLPLDTQLVAKLFQNRRRRRGAAAQASGRRGGAVRRRRAPDLLLRRRLRPALPRALGARDGHASRWRRACAA